jgi:Fe-S-cluster containining protein
MSDCHACGACCASLRVDFAVEETESCVGHVPDGLWVPLTPTLARMRGTDHNPPRCAALWGTVGQRVRCGIYEWRPGPCREFEAGSDACTQARRRHGLPPCPA